MRPVFVATPPDLPAIKAACAEAGLPIEKVPNILFYCKDDSGMLGVFGLDWSRGPAEAGPVFLMPGQEHKKWVLLRLIEAAEHFLANAGVDSYIFYIAEDNLLWRHLVERGGARPLAAQNGNIWYEKGTHNGSE